VALHPSPGTDRQLVFVYIYPDPAGEDEDYLPLEYNRLRGPGMMRRHIRTASESFYVKYRLADDFWTAVPAESNKDLPYPTVCEIGQ